MTDTNNPPDYQGSCAPNDNSTINLSVYMIHSLNLSGVLGLDKKGKTVTKKSLYLQIAGDCKAARIFLQQLVDDITAPSTGFKLDKYTHISAVINVQSPGGHYTGTARLGTDNGRNSGSAIVDTNAKVYGIDNLYIVYASTQWPVPWLSLRQQLPGYSLRTRGAYLIELTVYSDAFCF